MLSSFAVPLAARRVRSGAARGRCASSLIFLRGGSLEAPPPCRSTSNRQVHNRFAKGDRATAVVDTRGKLGDVVFEMRPRGDVRWRLRAAAEVHRVVVSRGSRATIHAGHGSKSVTHCHLCVIDVRGKLGDVVFEMCARGCSLEAPRRCEIVVPVGRTSSDRCCDTRLCPLPAPVAAAAAAVTGLGLAPLP